MKQAKWLLALAVVALAAVSVAPAVETQPIGSWPLLMGNTPQTRVGDVNIYWQYSSYTPGSGFQGFNDLYLGIDFVTYSTPPTMYNYPMSGDAHVHITSTEPDNDLYNLDNGHYNMFRPGDYFPPVQPAPPGYEVTPFVDNYHRTYLIPVAVLQLVPWNCGDYLWFICHVSMATGGSAYGGTLVPKVTGPGGHPWLDTMYARIPNPTPPTPPNGWEGTTRTRGYWKRFWWTTPNGHPPQIYTPEDVAKYLPVTLAGVTFTTAADFYGALDENGGGWYQFMAQFVSLYCNTINDPDILDAYYNMPLVSGEPCENKQVSEIYDMADDYVGGVPPFGYPTLDEMKTVMDNINNYENGNHCLWTGPQ